MEKLKSRTLTFFMLLFAIIASVFAVTLLGERKASADVIDENLIMGNGAYVRLTDEETGNGLRFVTGMTASAYEALMDNVGIGKTYKDVSFGILIAPADYLKHYDLTVENVFGVGAKYDWADENGVYTGGNGVDCSKVRIINRTTPALYQNAIFGDGYYFACSIIDMADANINRAFVGKGYVRYVDGEDNITYKMANFSGGDIANNTRTMLQVALAAIDSGDYSAEEESAINSLYINKVNFTVTATNCTTNTSSGTYGTTITLSGTPAADCTLKYIVNGERIGGNSFTLTENTTVTAINVSNTALAFAENSDINNNGGLVNGLYVLENIGLKTAGSLADWATLSGNGTVLYNGSEITEKMQVTQSDLGAKTIYFTNVTGTLGATAGDIFTVKAGYEIVVGGIYYITEQDYNFFFPGKGDSNAMLRWRYFEKKENISLSCNGGNASTVFFQASADINSNINTTLEGLSNEDVHLIVRGGAYNSGTGLDNAMDMRMSGEDARKFYFKDCSSAFAVGEFICFEKGFAIINSDSHTLLVTDKDYTFTYMGSGIRWVSDVQTLTLSVAPRAAVPYSNSKRVYLSYNIPTNDTQVQLSPSNAIFADKVKVNGTYVTSNSVAQLYKVYAGAMSVQNIGTELNAGESIVFESGFTVSHTVNGVKTAFVLPNDVTFTYLGGNSDSSWAKEETISLSLASPKTNKNTLYITSSKNFGTTLVPDQGLGTNNIATSVLKDGETFSGKTLAHGWEQKVFYLTGLSATAGTIITLTDDFYFVRERVKYNLDKQYVFNYDGTNWSVTAIANSVLSRSEGIRLGVFSSPKNTQADYNTCADAGFNFVLIDQNYANIGTADYEQILSYCNNAGMYSVIMTMGKNDKTFYADKAGYVGKFFYDEPAAGDFETIASYIMSFEALNPNGLFLNNLLPRYSASFASDAEYETYLSSYVSTVLDELLGEKILMVDFYPLIKSGDVNDVLNTYLYNLEKTAQIAKNTDIEVNYFVQTTGSEGFRDLESVADVLFQYYTGLAYGVKGFWAFTYNKQSGAYFEGHTALVNSDGVPTAAYDYVKSANANIKYISELFVGFDYVGTKAILGADNASNSCFNRLSKNLETVSGISEISASKDTLVGEFDKDGRAAYMVTNFSEPSAGATDTVTLTFTSSVTVDVYQDGHNIEWTGTSLELTLAAGEGAFVVVK